MSVAIMIAVTVNSNGGHEVVGMRVGPSEAAPFWTDLLRNFMRRGLRGVGKRHQHRAACDDVLNASLKNRLPPIHQ